MIKRNINTRWEDIKVITRLRRIKLKLFLRRFKHGWLIIYRNDPTTIKNGLESLKIALKETYLMLDTTVQEW